MYNESFKMQFLHDKNYQDSTKRTVVVLFEKIALIEETLEKDLMYFSKDEMGEMLKSLDCTTIRALQNNTSTIRQYLEYAYIRDNVMGNFRTREQLTPYLTEEKIDFTKEEVFDMAQQLPNAQDGVILLLLFEGVDYREEFKELASLTLHHLAGNELNLPNRTIPLDDKTVQLIHRANQEAFYKSVKGVAERTYQLTPSDFILKGVRNRVEADGKLILQRLVRIQKYFNLPKLNATNISLSGQVYLANKALQKENSMATVLDDVIDRFNLTDNPAKRHTLELKIKKK